MASRPGGDIRFDMAIDGAIRQARDALGRYTRLQGEALRANRKLADDLAALAARNLKGSLVRPKVSEGHLGRAVRRSHFGDRDRVMVGIEADLDASKAGRYWRQIEGFDGRNVWTTLVGRRMTGVWFGPGGVRGFQRVPWPGGLGQRFVPSSPAAARQALAAQARGGDRFSGTIRHGIRAERFYERAFKVFLDQRTHERLYEQLFARADLPVQFRKTS